MQTGPAQVGVHQQDALAVLRKDNRQIKDGGGFAFARATADHGQAVGPILLARKQDVRAQHPVSFGMRTFGPFLDQGTHILRDDTQHRRLQRALDIVNCLHAGIEVFDEEGQTNADDQSHNNSQRDVERKIGADRFAPRFGRVGDLHDGAFRQSQVHRLLQNAQTHRLANPLQIVQFAFGLIIRAIGGGFFGVVLFGGHDTLGQAIQLRLARGHPGFQAGQDAIHAFIDLVVEFGLHGGDRLEFRVLDAERLFQLGKG